MLRVSMGVCVWLFVCMYVCMYVCVCVCVRAYTYISGNYKMIIVLNSRIHCDRFVIII